MLATLSQDLRHGVRMLAKNPGFAIVAIISIAIGVGANAAMFSVADGLVLRPLPVPRAGEVVTISAITPGVGHPLPQVLVPGLRGPARPVAECPESRRVFGLSSRPSPSGRTNRRDGTSAWR